VAHHNDPAQSLQKQIAKAVEVSDRAYGIRDELNPVSVFGNQPPDQKVICRAILNNLVAAKIGQSRPCSRDRWAKREFHPI